MATPYDVLKAKWKQRQDTDTTVFGATRDEAVTKIKNLAQAVRFLPPLPSFFVKPSNKKLKRCVILFQILRKLLR